MVIISVMGSESQPDSDHNHNQHDDFIAEEIHSHSSSSTICSSVFSFGLSFCFFLPQNEWTWHHRRHDPRRHDHHHHPTHTILILMAYHNDDWLLLCYRLFFSPEMKSGIYNNPCYVMSPTADLILVTIQALRIRGSRSSHSSYRSWQ